MCTTCGCGGNGARIEGVAHNHDDHAEDSRTIRFEFDLLAKNNLYATENREYFGKRDILALNLVSSPGSGKTALLVKTIEMLGDRLRSYVIEGDQQTSNDAERIRATGAPAIQINTGKGCHLDAHMVGHGATHLAPAAGSVLFIENVGNLVCPAAFDLGETHKVVIFSVTEGEDKPLKYPDIFAASDLVLINKTDLLPHLDFDLGAAVANVRKVNPEMAVLQTSVRTGEGLEAWFGWIQTALAGVSAGQLCGTAAE